MSESVAKQASRRRLPAASPSLSREEIARVALEIGQAEGFEQLSMRSLARVLGVTPMALYHHVKDKKDLNALLVDTILSQVEIPGLDFGDWKARLGELTRLHYLERMKYPGFEVMLYEARLTPHGARLMEGYIQVLQDGGFSKREAVLGLSVLYAQGFGASIMDRQLGTRAGKSGPATAAPETGRPTSLAQEWKRALQSGNNNFYSTFRHNVLVAGLESIKGSLPDEE